MQGRKLLLWPIMVELRYEKSRGVK